MSAHQPGITAEVPLHARYMSFHLITDGNPKRGLMWLAEQTWGEDAVVGFGPSLVAVTGSEIPELREPKALAGPGVAVPATPTALWIWLRGEDRGDLLHRSAEIQDQLKEGFELDAVTDGFRFKEGRDLTGYVDGTENPEGDAALQAAIVEGAGEGLDGSSFVAVQTWLHDLRAFDGHAPDVRDNIIGRRIADNEEIDDAPDSAHVKRTAQESFDPEAFVLRRSMPWTEGTRAGLVFVAFGARFDAFEKQLERMVGLEDGVTDALFKFTHPLDTRYAWCPPVKDGQLDLSAIGF